MTAPLDLPALLTPDEAATLLRTSRRGVYAMAQRAQLPGVVRIGRRLLFRRDDLLVWLGLDPLKGPETGPQAPHTPSESTGYPFPTERVSPPPPNRRKGR
jgi:excisionase family DNA binding protein